VQLRVGEDLECRRLVVVVAYEQANLMARADKPPHKLLHAAEVGVVNPLTVRAIGGASPVRHQANSHRRRGASGIRWGREGEDEIRKDSIVLSLDTHLQHCPPGILIAIRHIVGKTGRRGEEPSGRPVRYWARAHADQRNSCPE
jgi:hypothetical protein